MSVMAMVIFNCSSGLTIFLDLPSSVFPNEKPAKTESKYAEAADNTAESPDSLELSVVVVTVACSGYVNYIFSE